MSLLLVCVCTYKRAELLNNCLNSVADIVSPDACQIKIIVVDNDLNQSAVAVVKAQAKQYPFEILYISESKRGIPCARNRAIDESIRLGAEYLVFIDDDEWVEKDWLRALHSYCLSKGGRSIISGDVTAELPENTPSAIKHQFTKQKRYTGEKLNTCATNNVIVPVSDIIETGVRFDETSPLAGGTDTLFFNQLSKKGIEIYKCMDAVVHESIPPHRTTLRWLGRRKFRAGITEALRKQDQGRTLFSIGVSAIFQFFAGAIKALIFLIVGNLKNSVNSGLKACKAVGIVAGALGIKVDSY